MKKYTGWIYVLCSLLFFIAGILGFCTGSQTGTVYICLGALWLCLGGSHVSRSRKKDKDNNPDSDSNE